MFYWTYILPYLLLTIFKSTFGQIVVQSEKLVGFDACNPSQQRQIVEAWHDAMKIADVVYKAGVNFDAVWAEPDFFGPPSLNSNDQGNIRAVLQNAHTFKLANDPDIDPDTPSINWGAWEINIRCDDWKNRCSSLGEIAAYTDNPEKGVNYLDTINFCPKFFDNSKLPSCTKAMDKWGNSKLIGEKESLQNYQCQGYAALHELFHLDNESKVGSQGHITDRRVNYKQEFDGRYVYRRAYGPFFARILAAWPDNRVGFFTGTNADNLAQYSLSKWVAQETGLYPRFPGRGDNVPNPDVDPSILVAFVDGNLVINTTAALPYVQGPLVNDFEPFDDLSGCDDFNSTIDDPTTCNDADNLPISLTSFSPQNPAQPPTTDVDYGYQNVTYDPYVLPDDPYLECTSDMGISPLGHPSVGQPWAQDQITLFCKLVNGIPMDNMTQSIINNAYPVPDTKQTMWLAAGWQMGDPTCGTGRTPDSDECNAQLGIVLNGCDTGTIAAKNGGVRVNNCIAWMMLP